MWKHYSCDYGVLVEYYDCDAEAPYIAACKALNEHITSDKGFGLGESYELGHSYFMIKSKKINHELGHSYFMIKSKKIIQSQMSTLWEEKIAPLLKEYLRTTYSENEIKKHLAEAKKLFALRQEN